MIKPDDGHYRPKHVVFLSKNITSNWTIQLCYWLHTHLLVTHMFIWAFFFSLTMPCSITSQNTELLFWIILYIRRIKSKVSKATRPNVWATKLSGCQEIRARQPCLQYVISVNTERLIQRPLRYTRRQGLWPACWLYLITTKVLFQKANRFLKCE